MLLPASVKSKDLSGEIGWRLDELEDKLGFEGEAKVQFLAQCDGYIAIYAQGEDDEFFK